jgi:histidinol-phosphate/aromatic aminotransferase/cobyric acid decarboxylase-like protein
VSIIHERQIDYIVAELREGQDAVVVCERHNPDGTTFKPTAAAELLPHSKGP